MTKRTRSAGLWEKVLPPIRQYLHDNPLASCADAAREFNLCSVTLSAHLKDEFDFAKRRAARGAKRRAKVKHKAEAVRAVLGDNRAMTNAQTQECRQVANGLIEVALKMVALQEEVARLAVTLARALPEGA